MRDLPTNIYSVAGVRELDRIAIEDHGVPGYELMQRAATAALDDALDVFPDRRRWQVLCGGGNNGGDGYVLARLAAERGIPVAVIAVLDPARLSGDAAVAYADFQAAGGVAEPWRGQLDTEATLICDALLGSGLDRNLNGDFAAAVDAVNAHPAPVHALDIPTGIEGDKGVVCGTAVVAELTTTFVGLKSGLFVGDGRSYCGEIRFAGLDIPPEWGTNVQPVYRRVDDEMLLNALPPRPLDAHKGHFGHVLVIGGGPGMPGAACLSGAAALRSGAGLVTVATHEAHAGALAAVRPELMVRDVRDAAALEPLLDSASVVAIGPGLGQDEWAREMLQAVRGCRQASVWDADALNLLAKQPDTHSLRVITPHPGEAGRLLGTTAADVQRDRLAALKALQEKCGGVIVLKGAGSLVSSVNGVPWLATGGNPGMAAPGMGDVLTGIIAGLLAQGLAPEAAAAVGVAVHAEAGDIAAENGERGMLASDVIDTLPWVVNP